MAAPAPTPLRRSRWRRLAVLAPFAVLAASGGSISPSPPPPGAALAPAAAPPQAATAEPARPADAPREPFTALRDRILREWVADEPAFARSRGLHEQDGKVGDYAAAAIERRLARLERDRAALAAVDAAGLSPDEALDRALLLQQIDLKLFNGRDLEEWRRVPQSY